MFPMVLPGGQPYLANFELLLNVPAGGQSTGIMLPRTYVPGVPTPLVIWCHGFTESTTDLLYPGGGGVGSQASVSTALTGAGYIVAVSAAHDDAWGSQAAVNDIAALYSMLTARYTIDTAKVGMVGVSMGGLTSTLTLAAGTVPAKGVTLICPVVNLANQYAISYYKTYIDAAYGITGTTPNSYAEKTAGHDPVLLPASSFPAIRYRFYASYEDAIASQTANTDNLRTLLTSRSPAVVENSLVQAVGGHGSPSHYDPDGVLAFFGRCFA